ECPEDGAVLVGIGAQAAVETRAQHGAGYGGGRASLAGAAYLSRVLQTQLRLRRLVPDGLAIGDRDGMHASRRGCQQVRGADEKALSIHRDSPLSTESAALPVTVLPHDRAPFVRVEGIDQAGLLCRDEQVFTVC